MSRSSMTGFAHREGGGGDWTWTIEARSVSGRSLEVRLRASAGQESLERQARQAAKARFQRGQIGLTVQTRPASDTPGNKVNHELLARYVEAAAVHVGSGAAAPPRADGLLALRGVIEADEADPDWRYQAALEEALTADIAACLDDLAAARAREGEALKTLVEGFLDEIERLLANAESAAARQPAQLRDRFARRLAELVGEAVDEARLLQEAAALAVRADVREELDRLQAHVEAARALARGPGASGRRLDFLAQEFMREANTLTAKAASPELTATGLDLKVMIDRMREQIQNVE